MSAKQTVRSVALFIDRASMMMRLSPQRTFALRLALGAFALIAAAWLFGAITEDVVNQDAPLGTLDLYVAAWLHARVTPV
jgi:hypothetical protein